MPSKFDRISILKLQNPSIKTGFQQAFKAGQKKLEEFDRQRSRDKRNLAKIKVRF